MNFLGINKSPFDINILSTYNNICQIIESIKGDYGNIGVNMTTIYPPILKNRNIMIDFVKKNIARSYLTFFQTCENFK